MYIEENIVNIIKYMKRIPYKNVYIGEAPINVDECVVVRATSGSSKAFFTEDAKSNKTRKTYDYPSYTIYVRSGDNQGASDLAYRVYTTLANYVGDDFVILTDRLPRFVGRDEKNRALYSFKVEYQLGGY